MSSLRNGGVHFPDDDLGTGIGTDLLASAAGHAHRVTLFEHADAFHGRLTVGDKNVQERCVGQGHGLSGLQTRDVHRGVLVLDPDCRVIGVRVHAGGDGNQTTGKQFGVDLQLLVAGGDSGFVRG